MDCPGLDFILKNQIAPVFYAQANMNSFKKIKVAFSLFEADKSDHVFSLKLAALFAPKET